MIQPAMGVELWFADPVPKMAIFRQNVRREVNGLETDCGRKSRTVGGTVAVGAAFLLCKWIDGIIFQFVGVAYVFDLSVI